MADNAGYLQELHQDLSRKWRLHRPRIEQIWRSLGRNQRIKAVKAGAAQGTVLKDPTDGSMGNVNMIIPEWNLRDLTNPESDYVLDLFRHRATTEPPFQYVTGVDGGPGDAQVIQTNMREHGLRHAQSFPCSFTLFMEGAEYGRSYAVSHPSKYEEVKANFQPLVDRGLFVPRSTGELIVSRQSYLFQALNILAQDILEAGSITGGERSKKSEKAAREALSTFSIDQKPEKLSLEDLAARAFDQKSAFEDYLYLCRSEPAFLFHVVNIWFFSQPELIPDEKGRVVPVITDRYISLAFYEATHNAVVQAAIWTYIYQLLQVLVCGAKDRVYRATMLQELSNVCDFEYRRSQKLFKRYVQRFMGSNCFKRISDHYDDGQARVRIKAKPDALARMDSQAHFMLRLCQPETDFTRAVDLIKGLDQLHQSHPSERENMVESELESFGDLAVTTNFIQSLARSIQLPSISRKKGQTYLSGLKALTAELDALKKDVDLSDFVIPIENIQEPGIANGALAALDKYIIDKAGGEIGFLYQDLNEGSLSEVQKQCQQQEATNAKIQLETPIPEPPSPSARIAQRKEKSKTRPPHSSVFSITSAKEESPEEPETAPPSSVFKVKPATVDVFSMLFSPSESRGAIKWASFEAAMTDLNFSVRPCFGSVFTFLPPPDAGVQKSITFHRPHHSRIEGFQLLAFAKRLRGRYGWGQESFEDVTR